ncbi:MAG: OmpA family protein [Gammaproteobacteria bacterium]|nr:OmpA family protein [Gammaproteobacteria bacterium]MBU1653778.1 OmpA family protein [Gammaproteobacteria bacterium]MBU1962120.1 OmpA family protein [Gammaproteobacteria bacterium]
MGEVGDRRIFSQDRANIVESPDTRRLARQRDRVLVERLQRGRSRETIFRPNGIQLVTIHDRWGNIIQRSRIMPNGREIFLSYGPEYRGEEHNAWRDPGRDLPPLRMNRPADDFILDADRVQDEREFYAFLKRPPVERIERLYSLNEVKRSARLRDKIPRIELNNFTFASGSAEIAARQVDRLEGLANAILRLLERNPAETFLIEGHSDAVGSDVDNLALSDRRAESLAIVLSDVFDIPPENLATRGYGERFLRIRTERPEPLNRRIVFRRITPLIVPINYGTPGERQPYRR